MIGDTKTTPRQSKGGSKLDPGSLVDQYRITRSIGRGAMGRVYLARDEQLGRRVALKVIRNRRLAAGKAQERFVEEARTTAKFNHPHIITIYGVGEHRGLPYLAMEYLEGQNLGQRLQEDRMGVDHLRVGLAVAEALSEAHRHDVVHRDLKPENIFIQRDGRLKVLDFGLARRVLTEEERESARLEDSADEEDDELQESVWGGFHLGGTPVYMAPEQWRHGEALPASDVWALGVVLYEIVAGRRPLADHEASVHLLAVRACDDEPVPVAPKLHGLPRSQRELILACLDKDHRNRPTADEIATQIGAVLGRRLSPSPRDRCPFPGLRPFSEEQAALYFGRDAEIDELLERLRSEPILPVVGPSGAGKSSFVRAGLIPRLRENESWIVLEIRPGRSPFLVLGGALATLSRSAGSGSQTVTVDDSWLDWDDEDQDQRPSRIEQLEQLSQMSASPQEAVRLADLLIESPGALGQRLRQLARDQQARVLLFVDQLEELYTLNEDEGTRLRFMNALCTAADDPLEPIRTVFTLRDDFLGRLAEGPRMREVLSRVTVLGPPSEASLEEILLQPLTKVGYRYAPPELPRRMVRAVRGEAASLPLLQFTARLLWDHRDKEAHTVTEAQYEALGGVEGALAAHADGVLRGMTPSQVQAARELLLRLITPRGTRHIVSVQATMRSLDEPGREVLSRLIEARLLGVRRSLAVEGGSAVLELVHESLIRNWARLARWFAESREDMAFRDQLEQSAELWRERGHREDEVWTGRALRDALDKAGRISDLTGAARAFLAAGEDRMHRVRRRRRGFMAAVVIALALIALGSLIGAFALADKEAEAQRQRAHAEEQQQRAEQRGADALREGARAAFQRGDMIQARAMLRSSLERLVSPLAKSLWWRMEQEPLLWQRQLSGDIDVVAFSPDGSLVAAICDSLSVYLIGVEDGSLRTLRGLNRTPYGVAFTADGRWLIATGYDGTAHFWDLERDVADQAREVPSLGGPLAVSSAGDLLAVGSYTGSVKVLSTSEDSTPRTFGESSSTQAAVHALAFHPSGDLLVAGSIDGILRAWDVQTAAIRGRVRAHAAPVTSLAFHPAGSWLVTGGADGTVRLWRGRDFQEPQAILRHSSGIRGVAFSPDGSRLVAASTSGTAHIWDFGERREIGRIDHTSERVMSLAFSPDGRLLTTGTTTGVVRLWHVERALTVEEDTGHTGPVYGASFSGDGKRLATASADRTLRLWEIDGGHQQALYRPDPPVRLSAALMDEGRGQVVAAAADGTIRVWNIESELQRRASSKRPSYLFDLAGHVESGVMATASFDGTIQLWDMTTGELRQDLYRHKTLATSLAFSPDGRWLASGGHDKVVKIWSLAEGRVVNSLDKLPQITHGLDFSPDGKILAIGQNTDPVRLWNLETNHQEPLGPSGTSTYWLDFHPGGRLVGIPRADSTAVIVDREDGSTVRLRGHHNEVNWLRFTPDGAALATTSDDGTVRLWETATGRPIWRAPAVVGQPVQLFTHRGWTNLENPAASHEPSSESFRRAIEERATSAVESIDRAVGCILTFDGQLLVWDIEVGRMTRNVPMALPASVSALTRGCVTLSEGQVSIHGRDETRELLVGASAVAIGPAGTLLVASEGEVRVHSEDSCEHQRSLEAGSGVRIMLALANEIVLGFADGSVGVVGLRGNEDRAEIAFEGVPASPPEVMAAGPSETLVVGYQNGFVGLWSLVNGSLVHSFRLHGPLAHLVIHGSRLHAVTELGDSRSLDLSTFDLDECALLERLWETVPVTWDDGTVRRSSPPAEHRCARE